MDGCYQELGHRCSFGGCVQQNVPKDGVNVGLYDIISKTKLQLWGVVPFSNSMSKAQEMGKLSYEIYGGTTPFCRAVENIATRCEGYKVPLFEGVDVGVKRKKVF